MKVQIRVGVCVLAAAIGTGCGGGSSPSSNTTPTSPTTPANRAPVINSMNLAPVFGIAQLTQFSFNASASDPDGDGMTYAWDVAGNPVSGSSGTMTFSNGGNGTARVTVTDSKGATATDTRSFVVGSMTGSWSGTVDTTSCTGIAKPMTASLSQSLTVVTGSIGLPNGLCTFLPGNAVTDPAEPGRIDASANVTIRIKIPPFTDVTFRGTMDTTGRKLTGGLFGSGHNGTPVVLNKQ
jgi:PKD domain